MKLPHRFLYPRYLLVAGVFFLGGCLFFDSSTASNNTVEPDVCVSSMNFQEALLQDCDFSCNTDAHCSSEPGFLCDANVCVPGCIEGCAIEDMGCSSRCDGESCVGDGDCASGFCLDEMCSDPMSCNEFACDAGQFCDEEEKCQECDGSCPCSIDTDCEENEACIDSVCEEDCEELSCIGDECSVPADCESQTCQNNQCVPSHCENGLVDEGEDGVDCGGPCPLLCARQSCKGDEECFLGGVCRGPARNKLCLPLVGSCQDIGSGRAVIGLGSPRSEHFPAYCDEEGWALLGISTAESDNWKHGGAYWTDDSDPANDRPGNSMDLTDLTSDLRSPAYTQLNTNGIKLCYQDLRKCFVFEHNQNQTLRSFFAGGSSWVSTKKDDPGKFLRVTGFQNVESVNCLRLGINQGQGQGLGLVGASRGNKTCNESINEGNPPLVLGVGMQPTTNFDAKGGYSRGLVRPSDLANEQNVGPWLIFGK